MQLTEETLALAQQMRVARQVALERGHVFTPVMHGRATAALETTALNVHVIEYTNANLN